MTTCHQDICPHMHFNKCYAQRIRSIPVTIFPDPTIDSFTNVNVKCGKQYKSNISTVAYQNFNFFHEDSNDDRNFVKDFYMENFQKDKMILNNNIVQELKQEMYKKSAYVLAEGATRDYDQFEDKRKKTLTNARNRAQSAYTAHVKHQKQQKQKDLQENGYWLKKLFRKLEQVAKHIIKGNGQDQGQRQKQFLMSKSNLTANFLSQIKIRDPKNAHDILEELRILMMKKKLQFSDQKQQQELNKSTQMSFVSQASQNTSQNSMLSQATSLNQSNLFGEDQIVQKYWDFNQLKKKWKQNDIQSVKQMIRRVLSKKIVYDAQLQAVKKRKEAQQINQKIQKMNLKQNGQKSVKNTTQKLKNKSSSQHKKLAENNIIKKQTPSIVPIKLTKTQQLAKTSIIQGGRFDAIGQKFMRNKTYSQIFKNKQNQIKSFFVENQLPKKVINTIKDENNMTSTKNSIIKR